MKVFFTLCISAFVIAASAQPGTLDASFGTGGMVSTFVNNKGSVAVAAAVQTDGKIVVAAQSGGFSDGDIVIMRYNTNGTPDNTFNGSGYVVTNLGNDDVTDMKLQTDGKIVVSGYTKSGDSTIALIIRYTTDGALDKSFGSGGIVRAAADKETLAYGLTIQPDGKIVAVGAIIRGWTDYQTILIRVNSDGTIDDNLGSKGIARTSLSYGPGRAYAVAMRGDKTLLTAGYNGKSVKYSYELYHFNEYGNTSWSDMNKEGRVTINVKDNDSKANAIQLLDDGGILMGGTAGTNDKADFGIVKLTSLGKPDKSFGSGGKAITDIGKISKEDELNALHVLPDGKILAAGTSANGELDGTVDIANAVLARYNSNGSLDNTFGKEGVAKYLANGYTYYRINALAVQPDGKVIIAGNVSKPGGKNEVLLLRFNN